MGHPPILTIAIYPRKLLSTVAAFSLCRVDDGWLAPLRAPLKVTESGQADHCESTSLLNELVSDSMLIGVILAKFLPVP